MDYYNETKEKLLDTEIYGKVKDYSKERHKVITYYETGKLLHKVGSVYWFKKYHKINVIFLCFLIFY